MIKLTGIFVAKDESTTMNKTPKKWRKALGFARIFLAFALFTFVGCGPRNTGDLIGVQGRGLWFHPQPFGTVYIPKPPIKRILNPRHLDKDPNLD